MIVCVCVKIITKSWRTFYRACPRRAPAKTSWSLSHYFGKLPISTDLPTNFRPTHWFLCQRAFASSLLPRLAMENVTYLHRSMNVVMTRAWLRHFSRQLIVCSNFSPSCLELIDCFEKTLLLFFVSRWRRVTRSSNWTFSLGLKNYNYLGTYCLYWFEWNINIIDWLLDGMDKCFMMNVKCFVDVGFRRWSQHAWKHTMIFFDDKMNSELWKCLNGYDYFRKLI